MASLERLLALIDFSPAPRPTVARRRPRQSRPALARRAALGARPGRRRHVRARQPRPPPARARRRCRGREEARHARRGPRRARPRSPDRLAAPSPARPRRRRATCSCTPGSIRGGPSPTRARAAAEIERELRGPELARVPRAGSPVRRRAGTSGSAAAIAGARSSRTSCASRTLRPDGRDRARLRRPARRRRRPGCVPWFAFPDAAWATHTVVFGHWAALGLDLGPHHVGPRHRLRVGQVADRAPARRPRGVPDQGRRDRPLTAARGLQI